jgi:drug/metabolite transporter (DMT)-like permease
VGWRLQFGLLALLWGASFLFIKVGVEEIAPIDVAFSRVALGAAVLLAAVALTRDRLPRGRRLWGHLFVVSILSNSVPFTLFAYAERHVTSVVAGLWNATTPLLVMLVAILMLPDERPTPRRIAGLVAGFAGVVVVLGPWRGLGGNELAGQLMCLGAAACYGVFFPYTRRFLAGEPDSGVALSAGQMLCATLQLGVATALVGEAPGHVSAEAAGSLLALGALGTGVAYILNFAIVRAAGATTASTVTYVVPVVSTELDITVLGEGLEWNQPLGAAVVLLSVAASQGLLRTRRRSPAT